MINTFTTQSVRKGRWSYVVKSLLFMAFIALSSKGSTQTTFTTTSTNPWSTQVWSPAGTPGPTDNVVINHNITADVPVELNNLTVNASRIFQTGSASMMINGTSTLNGTLRVNVAGQLKVLRGAVTLSSTGRIDNLTGITAELEFRNGISNGGVILLNAGSTARFSTSSQSLSGNGSVSIDNVIIQGNHTLTNQCGHANGFVIPVSLDGTAVGSTFTNAAGVRLRYLGANEPMQSAGTFNVSASGNTVEYAGAAQSIRSGSYFHISFTAAGTKTIPNIEISGDLIRTNGTLQFSGVQTFTGSNSASINTSAALTFEEVIVSKPGAVLTLLNNNITTGKLTVSSGIFSFGTTARTVTVNDDLAGNGTIRMNSAAHILNLSGENNSIGTLESDNAAARVSYNRLGDQEVFSSLNYQALFFAGSGTKTLGGAIKASGNVNLTASGSYFVALGDNSFKIGPAGSLSGSFSATRHIITDGEGFLIKEGLNAADFTTDMVSAGLYPVGSGGFYTPFTLQSLTATVTGTGNLFVKAVPTRQPNIPYFNNALTKHWVLETVNLSAIAANVRFSFNAAEVIGAVALYAPRMWDGSNLITPTAPSAPGSNPFTSNGTTVLSGSWTAIDPTVRSALYSYQSGDWNTANTWTTDPSGNTLVSPMVPQPGDQVVILNGRTVDNTGAATTVGSLTIQQGGVLDLGSSSGHQFGPISGEGKMRLSSVNLPSGNYNNFVASTGGTIEYYNLGSTPVELSNTLNTYNNLEFTNSSSTSSQLILNHNLTVNGNLSISRSASGNNTFIIGNAATARTLNVLRNVSLGAGCSWLAGNFNAVHTLNIHGNLSSSGTIDFTNSANYATATNGAINLHMQGSNSNTDITLNAGSNSTFYGFASTKSTGFQLSVAAAAGASANFVNRGNTFQANGNGTLRFGDNINIPVLIGGGGGNFDLGSSTSVPRLWIDGATISDGGLGGALVPYGTIRITSGSLTCQNGQSAIVIRESGALEILGGTVTAGIIRTSVTAVTHRGSFEMTAGTLNLLGNGGSEQTYYSIFSLPYPENVFKMSGGTITITRASTGGITPNGGFMVACSANNYEVSGGIINFNTTGNIHLDVSSTVPLHTVNIGRATAGNAQVRLNAIDWSLNGTEATRSNVPAVALTVLNDLNLLSSNAPTLNAMDQDLIIGGNLNINANATLVSGNNAIRFNSSSAQNFALNGNTLFESDGGSNLINGPEAIVPGANYVFDLLTTTQNAAIAPNGVQSAELVSETTGNGQHRFYTPFIPSSGPITASIHVKPAGRTCVSLQVGTWTSLAIANFNLTGAGSVTSTSGAILNSSITALADGWYRITATTNGSNEYRARVVLGNASCQTTYTGSTAMGIYVWGMKVENGGSASPYESNTNTGINSLISEKPGNSTLQITGTATELNIRGSLVVNSGELNHANKNLNVDANLTNNTRIYGTGTATVNLSGSGLQIVHGDGDGVIRNLSLSNNGGSNGTVQAIATAAFRISANLNLNSARVFDIQNHRLNIDAAATITAGTGGFSSNRFILTRGFLSDGGIAKAYSPSALSFTFPFGTVGNYTPATVSFSTAPSTLGTIDLRPVNAQQLYVTNPDAFHYYWKLNQTGFSTPAPNTINLTFNYGNLPDNTAYIPGYYNYADIAYTTINNVNAVNESTNEILFTPFNKFEGDYTAGVPAAFGTVVPYYSRANGNWNSPSTWSNTGHNGLAAAGTPNAHVPVFVGDGSSYNHTVTVTQNNTLSGSLLIGAGSTLDLGTTTGHNFGALPYSTAGGAGRIRISSATAMAQFPAGDFGLFFQPDGGTAEYYSTAVNFTIPSVTAAPTSMEIPAYRRLNIQPANSNRIIMPARDFVVYEDLNINSASASAEASLAENASHTISIQGNLNINGGRLSSRGEFEQNLEINGNLKLESGASLNAVHASAVENRIRLLGNLTINGDLLCDEASKWIIEMTGNASAVIDGSNPSAMAKFYQLNIDKGSDASLLTNLTMNGSIQVPNSNWLNLIKGTFRVSRPGALLINNESNLSFTIPAGSRLSVNHPSAVLNMTQHNSNGSDVILGGQLEILDGTVNIGAAANTAHNDLEYSAAGLPSIDVRNNAMLTINGQFRRSTFSVQGSVQYNQSGNSTVLVRGKNPETASSFNLDRAKFEILNQGSSFSMSENALLIIDRSGIASNFFGDIYLTPATFSMTGGEVVIGTGNTPSNTAFTLYSLSPFYNLRIDGTTTNKFVNNTNAALTVLNNFFIEGNSEFRANGFDVHIGGSFTNTHTSSGIGLNSGGFKPGTSGQTTFFNGSASIQNITGVLNNLTNFANLVLNNTTPAAVVQLQNNSQVRVNGNLTLTAGDLSLGNNNLTVLGNITSSQDVVSEDGYLILAGTTNQLISGNGLATIDKMRLSNSVGAELTAALTINENLNLNQGILYINNHLFNFGPNATATGSANANMMIRLNGVVSDAGVRKQFAAGETAFNFPIGTTLKYTPAEYSIAGNSLVGSITAKPVNIKHPATTDAADLELNYYWSVSSTGFSPGATFNHQYTYFPGDALNGTEANYRAGRFFNNVWVPVGGIPSSVNAAADRITLSGVNYINGDYTAGENTEFGIIQTYFSRNATSGGNWNDLNAWSTDLSLQHDGPPATIAPSGKNIVIAAGHTITITDNSKNAPTTVLNGNLVLGNTFGHNFGVVTGTGLVRISPTASNTFLFPGGDFNAFTNTGGGTFEFNSASSATLPSHAVYNNITFSGSGNKSLPNTDLIVNGNVQIAAGVVTNASNRQMQVKGNWTNMVGLSGFVPGGSGVVELNGTAQSLNGATGFSTLRISNGGVKELNASINVTHLHLVQGLVQTNANIITISSLGSVTGGSASSYVHGNLRKGIPAATVNVAFEIGDAARYAPVNISFAGSVNAGGSLMASTAAGDHPDMYLSGLNSLKSANRTWTLTPQSLSGFSSYTGRFNFVSADLDPSSNPLAFKTSRYLGGLWTMDGTSIGQPGYVETSGLTAFGLFQAGEAVNGLIWTGNVNTNWNLAGNWQPNTVPGNNDDITIGLVANQPSIHTGSNGSCRNINMAAGVSINIPATHNLSISGNIQSDGASTQGNGTLVFNNSSGSLSGNLTVGTHLIIPAGSGLSLSNDASLELQRDVTVTGQLSLNGRPVSFSGAQGSRISGVPVNFNNLTINKSSDDLELLLAANVNVQGNLTMQSGDINLNGHVLNLSTTGSLVNETTINRVYGSAGSITAQRNLNNISDMNVAGLGAVLSSSQNLGLTTIIRGHQQRTYNAGFGMNRYYEIHPTNNSNLNATLKFNYFDDELQTALGTIVETELDLWRYDGAYWNVQWATLDAGNNQLVKTNIAEFSTWTGGSRENNALPVTLTAFEAECLGDQYLVSWSTASESNNREFTIEESEDALSWKKVHTQQGAGNSNVTRRYEANIKPGFVKGSYLRLRQTDFNGNFEIFDPIFVGCKQASTNTLLLSPNPASTFIDLQLNAEQAVNANVAIFSSAGQLLLNAPVKITEGKSSIRLDLKDLPAGVYHLNLSNDKHLEFEGSRSIIKR